MARLTRAPIRSLIVQQQPHWSHPSQRPRAPAERSSASYGVPGVRPSWSPACSRSSLLVTPTTVDRISLATSTYLCSGYAECQAAGYGNAGYRQASSTTYWRMYAGHNCTNYVAYRLIQSGMPDVRPWEGSGNASNWGVAMAEHHRPDPHGRIRRLVQAARDSGRCQRPRRLRGTGHLRHRDHRLGGLLGRRLPLAARHQVRRGLAHGVHPLQRPRGRAHDGSCHRRVPCGRCTAGGGGRRVDAHAHQRHRSLARRRCRHPRRHRGRLRPHARREGQGPHRRGDGRAERLHRRQSRPRHRSRCARGVPAHGAADDPGCSRRSVRP